MAGDFAVFEAVGAAPYFDHELGDELFGTVAAIAAGLWQASALATRPFSKKSSFSCGKRNAACSVNFLVVLKYPVTHLTIKALNGFARQMPLSDLNAAPDAYGAFCLSRSSCEQQRNMLKSPYLPGYPKKYLGPAARPAYDWIH